jgi:hypothetical protein
MFLLYISFVCALQVKKNNFARICGDIGSVASICTINESIKGATSLSRYGITFDGNIDFIVHFQGVVVQFKK